MDQRIGDFATSVIKAADSDAVWASACAFFESFGFDGVMYGVRSVQHNSKLRETRVSRSLTAWREAYFRAGDDQRDPLFTYDPIVPPSFLTGVEFLPDYKYLQKEEIAVIHRAADFGLVSGLAMKMPNPSPAIASGWNFVSGIRRKEMLKIHRDSSSLLGICATLADREMQQKPPTGANLRLTRREVECLSWLAAGLRTEQISDRMGIKPVTVDLHIRNARKRLGARTREQALAIALHQGLIQP